MPRYTVHYTATVQSSILIDAQDWAAAADAVERQVMGGQHLAKAYDVQVDDIVPEDEDPAGDW